MTEPATDYRLSDHDADDLVGMVLMPADLRGRLLRRYLHEHGEQALVNLFSQFIGMANSVVANNREMLELYHVTELGQDPRQAEKINLPTLFGALQGVKLAHGVGGSRKMCEGCAYRLGSPANQCHPTVTDARDCAENGEDFYCHKKFNADGSPSAPCAGHQTAQQSTPR